MAARPGDPRHRHPFGLASVAAPAALCVILGPETSIAKAAAERWTHAAIERAQAASTEARLAQPFFFIGFLVIIFLPVAIFFLAIFFLAIGFIMR